MLLSKWKTVLYLDGVNSAEEPSPCSTLNIISSRPGSVSGPVGSPGQHLGKAVQLSLSFFLFLFLSCRLYYVSGFSGSCLLVQALSVGVLKCKKTHI